MPPGGQNIISLGINVDSFNEQKLKTLDEFITRFNLLEKYDGKVYNPIMGDGLVAFNTSLKETTSLLDQLNSKINTSNSSTTQNTSTVNQNTSARDNNTRATNSQANSQKILQTEYEKLTDKLKKQIIIYQELALAKGKDDATSKQALVNLKATAQQINAIDKQVDGATGRFKLFGGAASTVFSHIRNIAYILPGIGIAGIFNLAFEAIGKAADELGVFDNATDKAIEKQIKFNTIMKDFIDIVDDYEKALKSTLNTDSYNNTEASISNELAFSKALNKSKQDQLDIEFKLLNFKALQSNQKFFSEGGFTKQEEAYKKFRDAEYALEEIQKSFRDRVPNDQDLMGHGKVNEERYKNQVELAKLQYDITKQNFIKIKDINELNAKDSENLQAKQLEIQTFKEEERLKIVLNIAKNELDGIKVKNKLILDDDRSTMSQRIAALKNIRDAEKVYLDAQIQNVKSKPGAYNSDGTPTAETETSVRDAVQAKSDLNKKYLQDTEKVQIEFYQRLIKAKTEINKDEVETEANKNERVFKNETNSLEDRLVAYSKYIEQKQKLQELELTRDLQKGASNEGGKTSLTKEERTALTSSALKNELAIQADVEKQVYDIVYTSVHSQLKLIQEANDNEEKTNKEAYAKELNDLNDSYEKKTIKYHAYKEGLKRINDKYKERGFEEDVKDDLDDIRRLEEGIGGLQDVRNKLTTSNTRVDNANVNLQFAKDTGGDTKNAQKEYDSAIGEQKALQKALEDIEDEHRKKKNKLDDDNLKLAKSRNKDLTEDDEKRAKKRQAILEAIEKVEHAVADAIRSISDAQTEKQISQLEERQRVVSEGYQNEIDAIDKSTLSAKDKAALDIQLNAQKSQSEKQAAAEEKKLRHEQAVINKEISISEIILSTTLAVMSALRLPPPAGEIAAIERGAIGAIQLATAIATPIPEYAHGVESHPGGLAKYGEAGAELVKEPNKAPYLVMKETISYLPKGTEVIPIKDDIQLSNKQADDGWQQVKWLARKLKPKENKTEVKNKVIINLGFELHKAKILGN